MTRSKKTGRISSTLPLYHFSERFARCASAASLAAFLQFPAFFSSCTQDIDRKEEEVQLLLTTKSAGPEAVDLFFFDTLGIQRLDAYQQISDWSQTVYGLSATGVKRLVALSGKSGDQAAWSSIRTYGDLCKHRFSLERESVRSPLLYGELLLKDGVSRRAQMELHPMLAAIRLRSVSCDFSGRPYVNGNFLCKQLFLTYAGSECLPLGQGDGGPVSWLNPGFLDSTAVRQLPDTSLVWQRGFGAVGRQRTYPDRFFYCYPGADTHRTGARHLSVTGHHSQAHGVVRSRHSHDKRGLYPGNPEAPLGRMGALFRNLLIPCDPSVFWPFCSWPLARGLPKPM